jgi:hypothetical protein
MIPSSVFVMMASSENSTTAANRACSSSVRLRSVMSSMIPMNWVAAPLSSRSSVTVVLLHTGLPSLRR